MRRREAARAPESNLTPSSPAARRELHGGDGAPAADQCRRFFVRQVVDRHGLRACIGLSAAHPHLAWLRGLVNHSMLSDRTDPFLVHGQAYLALREEVLGRRLPPSADPAPAMLALFYGATACGRLQLPGGRPGGVASRCSLPVGDSTDSESEVSRLVEQAGGFLPVTQTATAVRCAATIVEALQRIGRNGLGGEGRLRELLAVGPNQPEAGVLLHALLPHLALAAALGGALTWPFQQLLVDPLLLQNCFLPAVASFEDSRTVMQATAEVTKWYACANGHPFAVGDCGRFGQAGRSGRLLLCVRGKGSVFYVTHVCSNVGIYGWTSVHRTPGLIHPHRLHPARPGMIAVTARVCVLGCIRALVVHAWLHHSPQLEHLEGGAIPPLTNLPWRVRTCTGGAGPT